MKKLASYNLRVLAIDPSARGFGFAVLEGEERLIDWGLKQVKKDKNSQCLARIKKLIHNYLPDAIVVEEFQSSAWRRGARVQELIRHILTLAATEKVRVQRFSRKKVLEVFSHHGAQSKALIAAEIAQRFPELAPRLPKARKSWMSEDERICIFDAVALALTHFSVRKAQRT